MRTIKSLTETAEKVYIICNSERCAMQFLMNAEDEGITIGHSTPPTQGTLSDMYCLHNDGTLWYMSMAGRMKYHSEKETAICVDYKKYKDEEAEYLTKY